MMHTHVAHYLTHETNYVHEVMQQIYVLLRSYVVCHVQHAIHLLQCRMKLNFEMS